MGNTCFPNVAPKSTFIQQSKITPPPKLMNKQQLSHSHTQTQVLIAQLHSILTSTEHNHQQATDSNMNKQLILKKLQPNIQQKVTNIANNLIKYLSSPPIQDIEPIHENIIVSSYIVSQTETHKPYSKLTLPMINTLATEYLTKQTNPFALQCAIKFIDRMFLDFGYTVYSNSQKLYQTFINKFSQLLNDSAREQLAQILVEMLLDNKKLLKYTNMQYYFLQFWLYTINQQTQLDRQLYWIQAIKKIYASDKSAQDCLFYQNDFRVFVDLLVRVIYECPDGKSLRIPLECYLVLSCTEKMQQNILRLSDIKNYIGQIDGESLGVSDLFKEINALK